MENITEMRQHAARIADNLDMNWDKLDDPMEARFFVERTKLGTDMIPTLESLYTKLSNGKSVILPDSDSPLEEEERAEYLEAIEEELVSAYVLDELHQRFILVNDIIARSGSLE